MCATVIRSGNSMLAYSLKCGCAEAKAGKTGSIHDSAAKPGANYREESWKETVKGTEKSTWYTSSRSMSFSAFMPVVLLQELLCEQ